MRFTAAFDQNVPLSNVSVAGRRNRKDDGSTNLERVLTGEALVAVATWERLDGEMNALMPLQVVISVETLRALIASEGSVVLRARL